jgi:hypothetical protein
MSAIAYPIAGNSYTTSSAWSRIGGLLMIVVPAVLLCLLSGWGFHTHSAWQTRTAATVENPTSNGNGSVQVVHLIPESKMTSASLVYSIAWNTGEWENGHNSYVDPQQTVQVWALLGSDGFGGHQILALSQYHYPHDYSLKHLIPYFILLVIGAFCAGLGLYLLFRNRR